MLKILIILGVFCTSMAFAESGGSVSGIVSDSNGPIAFATVGVSASSQGAITDVQGQFLIEDIAVGTYQLVARAVGYAPKTVKIEIREGGELRLAIQLEKSEINLDQVVVTGTSSAITLFEAPVIVSRINQKSFESTQSITLAEGLSFSPGLGLRIIVRTVVLPNCE